MRLSLSLTWALAMACGVGAGCGSPVLHTAAPAGARLIDPGLSGEWTATEPVEIRAVIKGAERKEPSALSLTIHDKGQFKTALSLELVLTQIGNTQFADVFMARPERDKLVETYGFLAIPVHQLFKLSRDGDTLTVWPFNAEFLQTHAPDTAHDRVAVGGGDTVIVTASTQQVRDLLERHGSNPTAFGEAIILTRSRN